MHGRAVGIHDPQTCGASRTPPTPLVASAAACVHHRGRHGRHCESQLARFFRPVSAIEGRTSPIGLATPAPQNGSPVATANGHARSAAASSEVAQLRSELSDLKEMLLMQSQQLQQQGERLLKQEEVISGLNRYITKQRQSITRTELPPAQYIWAPQSTQPRPFDAQRVAIGDRRYLGCFDARFHSTSGGATPQDFRVLPERIILVRHAQSEGNVDNKAYSYIPDPKVPLTAYGKEQARTAGEMIHRVMQETNKNYRLFFYTSPYKRSLQTFEGISGAIPSSHVVGVQEEVQLREQDFGNFQDVAGKAREKAERLRFGRFFYRFPHGESSADVYDRVTLFEDHMIRDINAGRFANHTSLVLVSHGLALRVFLMRWFHWTVDQFLSVYNPPNAEPLVLERTSPESVSGAGGMVSWMHTKALYRLTEESQQLLRGCTPDMCTTTCLPPTAKPYRQVSSTEGNLHKALDDEGRSVREA